MCLQHWENLQSGSLQKYHTPACEDQVHCGGHQDRNTHHQDTSIQQLHLSCAWCRPSREATKTLEIWQVLPSCHLVSLKPHPCVEGCLPRSGPQLCQADETLPKPLRISQVLHRGRLSCAVPHPYAPRSCQHQDLLSCRLHTEHPSLACTFEGLPCSCPLERKHRHGNTSSCRLLDVWWHWHSDKCSTLACTSPELLRIRLSSC
mmetsp:Transcript_93056/g.161764  ORF Transcript_93056/g.161764 Transcript_93056/m.161764 type:complete len:204 (-) Transcript_93056:1246-1857(-)